jgi:hypothetical protein
LDAIGAISEFLIGIPEEPSTLSLDEWNAFLRGPWQRLDSFTYEQIQNAWAGRSSNVSRFRVDMFRFFMQSKDVYLSWYVSGEVWREVEMAREHFMETGRPDSGLEYHAMTSLNEGGFGIHHHKIHPREFMLEGLEDPDEDYRSHMRHILSHMDSAPGEKVVGITFDDMKSELHGFQFEVWLMETRD